MVGTNLSIRVIVPSSLSWLHPSYASSLDGFLDVFYK
jgi:hypothetical protein